MMMQLLAVRLLLLKKEGEYKNFIIFILRRSRNWTLFLCTFTKIKNLRDKASKTLLEVIELTKEDIVTHVIDRNMFPLKEGWGLEPITLTDEWLIKFGFKSNQVSYKIDNERFIFELYFYDAWNLNYVEKPKFGNGSVELSGYWKIHELQNLYFALTGEELQLK